MTANEILKVQSCGKANVGVHRRPALVQQQLQQNKAQTRLRRFHGHQRLLCLFLGLRVERLLEGGGHNLGGAWIDEQRHFCVRALEGLVGWFGWGLFSIFSYFTFIWASFLLLIIVFVCFTLFSTFNDCRLNGSLY
jgi:hypothetical protein